MTSKRVFCYFFAFFGFIAAVNAVMITLAVRSHSGLVTDHPYEEGLAYNQVIQAEEKQTALGWRGNINYHNNILSFELLDKKGKPIIVDKATATITRPTKQGMDFTLELIDQHTPVTFPTKGSWDVRVDAFVGDKTFQQIKRIIVE